MKKFLALLLSVAMMLIPMSAFAADIPATIDIDYNANEITFSGNFTSGIADEEQAAALAAELAARTATLVIVNPGKNVANFEQDGVLAWADQAVVAADGSVKFVVDMTSSATGVGYEAFIAVSGTNNVIKGKFNYTVATTALQQFGDFKQKNTAANVNAYLNIPEVAQTAQIETEVAEIGGFTADVQERIYTGVMESKAEDFAQLKAAVQDSIKAYKMMANDNTFKEQFDAWAAEDAETLAIYNNFATEDTVNDDQKAVRDTVKAVKNNVGPKSKVEFMAVYRDAVLTEKVNNAKNDTAINTFIVTTAKKDIAEATYNKYLASKKDEVQTILFGQKPFANMTDFVDKLDKACDKAGPAPSNNGGGSSGGSSGGSGKNPTSITVDPQLLVPPTTVVTNPFADIPDNFWAKDAILELYKRDIVAGQGANTFNPNATITRAEFVQMVVKAFGFGMNGTAPQFVDVTNEWFANAVAVAYTNGIVKGTTDTTFAPMNNITRQDMMVILTNAAKAGGKTLTSTDKAFTDAAEISAYAQEAVSAMVGSGVVSGYVDGSVKPLANATRAEAAAMLNNILAVN